MEIIEQQPKRVEGISMKIFFAYQKVIQYLCMEKFVFYQCD
jgi:hypothetical protein